MLGLIRGDTNEITIRVRRPLIDPDTGEQATDQRGMPLWESVDLTGATLYFTARDRRSQAVIELDSNPGTGLGGIVFLEPLSSGLATATVTGALTENLETPVFLRYDVQMIEEDGTKTTVNRGEAVVTEDTTRG